MDREAEQTALRYFGQRLVGIAPVYRLKGEGKGVAPIVKPYSGTLLMFEGVVSILTAGHVIQRINELYENPDIEIETCLLIDNVGLEAKHDQPIPFDWRSAAKAFIDEDGLDFGIVTVRRYYVNQLAANGVKVVEEQNWVKQHTLPKLDAYFMLGFPEELNLPRRYDPYGGTHLTSVMARIDVLDEVPVDSRIERPSNPIFVAKLRENLPIKSTEGMSGGPMIGMRLNDDGQLVYWVVALVRTCLMSERLVTGCPLPVLGKILRLAADDALAEPDAAT
jgi:hypothetical protein